MQLAAGEIIEEEQGLGALHQHIVHAHGHQVDAHGVVHIPLECQLELGAHAVGAAHQHRLLVALGHLEQRAEAADAGHHAFAQGFLGQRLDALDQRVARVDVDASVFVGNGSGGSGGAHGREFRVRKARLRRQNNHDFKARALNAGNTAQLCIGNCRRHIHAACLKRRAQFQDSGAISSSEEAHPLQAVKSKASRLLSI
ncbi:hypothetical protein SDC9_140494 [bioreactor metagenome]|uniref:Uncharacterized protein n=1 Tax=bioreactor metagenome TaxID=1076179 RepID=A0A645DVG2_9ZZZZ